jgi:hypothetical protein
MARSQSRYTRIIGNGLLEQAEATQYHREQVVEVVRYPSGQLTDAFHFLGFVQLPQRDLPLARTLLEPAFQLVVLFLQRVSRIPKGRISRHKLHNEIAEGRTRRPGMAGRDGSAAACC